MAGWSIFKAIIAIPRPRPAGSAEHDWSIFEAILKRVSSGGPDSVVEEVEALDAVITEAATADPDAMSREGALAYWLNLYNALALRTAAKARMRGLDSMFRVTGAFDQVAVVVSNVALSLDGIEHGKVRRFKDPRIHAALVCGAASCPTLRDEPYRASSLDRQLDDQMRSFLNSGGLVVDDGVIRLSRIFSWFGSDFVRPERMPTLISSSRRAVVESLRSWTAIPPTFDRIEYQPYDWDLRCSVG